MMIKVIKYFFILNFLFLLLTEANAFLDKENKGAQSDGRQDSSFLETKNSSFKKGKDAMKKAIKYKNKNKSNKANKRFEKALKYFTEAYKKQPNNIELLNYLGFTYHMVGDILMSEIYYKQGLGLDPKNNSINQRLGELYFHTKRIHLAKEKLKILSNCNCEEYSKLKKLLIKQEN